MSTPSATGSGRGGTVFAPPNQPEAANAFASVLTPEVTQSISGLNSLNQTPASLAYPYVQQDVLGGIQNNPYALAAQNAAGGASDIASYQTVPTAQAGGGALAGLGGLAAGQAPGTLAAGGGVYNTLASQAPGAFGAGQGTFDYLRSLAPGLSSAGQGAYSTLTGQAPQTFALGGAFANNAFDPQAALFNRTQQQLIDQSNAVNSMSGVAGTPYGASLTNNALGNFDINWQANQLARQQAGLAGLEGANTSGTNLILGGTGALNAGNTAAGNLTLGGLGGLTSGDTTGANLLGTGLNALYGGNTSLGNLISGAQGGYGGATGLYGTAGQQLLSGASAPYNTSIGIQGNNLSGLSNLINLGNQNYALPQQVLGNLSNYLGLGQDASKVANTIGSTNFNQMAAGFQGAGSLLGSGLGFGSPSNPGWLASGVSGLGGLGGLFGGGAAAGGGIDAATAAALPFVL